MILLLLLTCCSAVLSTYIELLNQLLDHHRQSETFALVTPTDDDGLSSAMGSVACYRVKCPPIESIAFNPDGIRECSMILVDAGCVHPNLVKLPCLNVNSKVLIIYETHKRSLIDQLEGALRSVGIFNTFHVISDPLAIVTFDISGQKRMEWSSLPTILGKQFSDLGGYRYKVHYTTMEPYSSVYENAGIDISIAKEVIKRQNATIEFVRDLGSLEKMRSILAKYSGESIDFSICRTLLSESVSKDRVFLPQWEQLCVIVPRRHTRLLLVQLVKPFTVELWVVLVFYLGVRFTRKFDRFFERRLILVLLLLVDFCLMESYLAKAMSFLIDMRYDADPRTMEELDRRGETFVALSSEKEALDGYSGLRIIEVEKKLIEYYQQYAIIIYCKMAEYYDNTETNFDPDSNDKLVAILKERLMLYPAFYSFAGGHPLRSRFQLILDRMLDAGIWAKIYNRWTSDVKQFESYLSGMENVISFADMHSLWILLVGGFLTGLACFFVEMISKR